MIRAHLDFRRLDTGNAYQVGQASGKKSSAAGARRTALAGAGERPPRRRRALIEIDAPRRRRACAHRARGDRGAASSTDARADHAFHSVRARLVTSAVRRHGTRPMDVLIVSRATANVYSAHAIASSCNSA